MDVVGEVGRRRGDSGCPKAAGQPSPVFNNSSLRQGLCAAQCYLRDTTLAIWAAAEDFWWMGRWWLPKDNVKERQIHILKGFSPLCLLEGHLWSTPLGGCNAPSHDAAAVLDILHPQHLLLFWLASQRCFPLRTILQNKL